jgi:hypothetical protein
LRRKACVVHMFFFHSWMFPSKSKDGAIINVAVFKGT